MFFEQYNEKKFLQEMKSISPTSKDLNVKSTNHYFTSNEIKNKCLHEVLDANVALLPHEGEEYVLIGRPVLDDVSLWWEKAT